MSTSYRSGVAVALVIACGVACSAESSPPARSAERVDNPADGHWATTSRWRVEPVWRVGGAAAEGAAVFQGPLSLSVGPDDNLYVADARAREVKVFDANGQFLRVLASPGRGPGEIGTPIALGWDSSRRLWVVDAGNGRYKLFSVSGEPLSEFPRDIVQMPRMSQPLVFDNNGALVDVESAVLRDGRIEIGFVRVDSAGRRMGVLPPLVERPLIPADAGGVERVMPQGLDVNAVRPRIVYSVSPDGHIWFAESTSLRLYLRTYEGDTLKVVQTQHRNWTLDDDETREVQEWLRSRGIRTTDVLPGPQIVQGIYPVGDHILVQVPTTRQGRETSFDIFDGEGRFMGSVPLGVGLDPVSTGAFQGDTLYAVGRDELDAPFIIKAVLVREGT